MPAREGKAGGPSRRGEVLDRKPRLLYVPANDALLEAEIEALATNQRFADLKSMMASTLDLWKTKEPQPELSEGTARKFLGFIMRSRFAGSFNGQAFLREIEADFGVLPSLDLYNCILEGFVATRQPVSEVHALLEEIKEKGFVPNWSSYVAILSVCTANADSRAATRFLKELKQQELQPGDLSKAQQQRLSSALLNLAITASRGGGIRDSVEIIKYMNEIGQPPSPLMLQETLQTAVDHADHNAAVSLVELLRASLEKADVPLAVDEGQCLSLLNCAANTASRRLAAAAWNFLQSSLAVKNHEDSATPRWPLPVCYHAYMHTLAVTRQIGPAFDAAAELQAVHPGESHTWYGGLSPIVHGLSTTAVGVETAEKVLEERLAQGNVVTSQMSDCLIAAAGNVRHMNRAFHVFDAFAELNIGPTTDTYSAVLSGCVKNGLLDSVPMILREFQDRQLQPNEQLWTAIVWFYIAARDPEGVLKALEDMRAEGFPPSLQLLDAAVARMEREGHEEGIRQLLPQLNVTNFRNRAARLKASRWISIGGIGKLADSHKFLPRGSLKPAALQE